MAPADVLAAVATKFDEVRARLDVQLTRSELQLTRSARLQEQLDTQRREVAELRRALGVAENLLKKLLTSLP